MSLVERPGDDDSLRLCTIVDTLDRTSTQVGTEPMDGVCIHGTLIDAAEMKEVIDSVEGFEKSTTTGTVRCGVQC